MPITIDIESTTSIAASNPVGSYPNIVVVNFGLPEVDAWSISMRDLTQWAAYRFDSEGGNHRTASLLRAIAERYYPMQDDEALWIIENLQNQGINVNASFEETEPPAVDLRLLDLVDGFALCSDTCSEPLWDGQPSTAVLDRNAKNYLDFEFPNQAYDDFGIRGIRVFCVDLVHWVRSSVDLEEAGYQDEDAWLDALKSSVDRHVVNTKHRSDMKLRARHGDHAIDYAETQPKSGNRADRKDLDAILEELAGGS